MNEFNHAEGDSVTPESNNIISEEVSAQVFSSEVVRSSSRKLSVMTCRHDDAVASRIDDLRAHLGVV
jgi:hypothetical protein